MLCQLLIQTRVKCGFYIFNKFSINVASLTKSDLEFIKIVLLKFGGSS